MKPPLLVTAGFALLLLAASTALPGDDASALVAKLRKKYDRIGDLSLSFRQTTVFAVSKVRQSSEGALALAKGNRYRVAFDDRVIVSDGSTVWSWSKSNAQVIVDRFRDDPTSLTPERLLVRIPAAYAALLLGAERVGKDETRVVKLTPPAGDRSVRWVKLWVDEDRLTIVRLQLSDLAENDITYELSDIRIDTGLPDSTFRMAIPAGAEILDLR